MQEKIKYIVYCKSQYQILSLKYPYQGSNLMVGLNIKFKIEKQNFFQQKLGKQKYRKALKILKKKRIPFQMIQNANTIQLLSLIEDSQSEDEQKREKIEKEKYNVIEEIEGRMGEQIEEQINKGQKLQKLPWLTWESHDDPFNYPQRQQKKMEKENEIEEIEGEMEEIEGEMEEQIEEQRNKGEKLQKLPWQPHDDPFNYHQRQLQKPRKLIQEPYVLPKMRSMVNKEEENIKKLIDLGKEEDKQNQAKLQISDKDMRQSRKKLFEMKPQKQIDIYCKVRRDRKNMQYKTCTRCGKNIYKKDWDSHKEIELNKSRKS